MTGKISIKRPRGRPLNKPDYDPEEVLSKILSTVCAAYDDTGEIKATAAELDLGEPV